MDWFDEHGETMSSERWTDPSHRTLQYLATSTPENEELNRILLVVHGNESPVEVTLPDLAEDVEYVSLWSSADETPSDDTPRLSPGDVVPFVGTSMRLFRVDVPI
jgi:glycogen operon protein